RPHIQQMVRRHHGFCIVLDHDHRVAQVTQAQQGVEQAPIIALMETDRWFIKNVENADEAGTDLRCEPDALAFSTTQRRGPPIQCQVIQADVHQKPEPFADFFQDAMGDYQLAFREFYRTEEVERGSHGEMRHLRDRLCGQLDGEAFRPQPRALADLAGLQQGEVFLVRIAGGHGVADAVTSLAGSMRTIERKDARCNFRITDAAADAGELLAIEGDVAIVRQHTDQSSGELQGGLYRIGQPPHQRITRLHHQPIDHDLDRVFFLFVERDFVPQVDVLAVDTGANIPGPAHVEKFLSILSLPAADDGGQELKLAPLWQRTDGVHHLLDGLRRDLFATLKAGGASNPGKEE